MLVTTTLAILSLANMPGLVPPYPPYPYSLKLLKNDFETKVFSVTTFEFELTIALPLVAIIQELWNVDTASCHYLKSQVDQRVERLFRIYDSTLLRVTLVICLCPGQEGSCWSMALHCAAAISKRSRFWQKYVNCTCIFDALMVWHSLIALCWVLSDCYGCS